MIILSIRPFGSQYYINMGATCTKLDISPEAARVINSSSNRVIQLDVATYEAIWVCLAPYIKNAIERSKIRRLLRNYLAENPCRDRFLCLKVNDTKWMFEITGNTHTREYTEVVLSHHVTRRPKN